MFFRATRHAANDLFASGLISAHVNEKHLQLNDISISGISLVDSKTPEIWDACIGDIVELRLSLPDGVIFRADAEIVRTEMFPGSCKIGLSFVNASPDLSLLAAQDEEARLISSLESEPALGPDLVPAAYKAVCADVLHLLNWQRELIEAFEKRVAGQDASGETIETAYQAVEERVLARWRVLWQRGEDLVRDMSQDSPEFQATKQYTEQVITPAFMAGPVWNRSYLKPRGYPGDYAIMKMVYAWAREGESLADRLVHRIGLEVAECIATRMILVQQAIAAAIEKFGIDGTAQIASLGCGPAKEIENVMSATRLSGKVHFTLIDQDLEALEDTYGRLMPMAAQTAGQADISVLRETFVEIVRGGVAEGQLEGQHLIYTVGLVDYLRDTMARGLVTKLYNQLAPGGTLIIGNMAASDLSNYWPMEFITDWRVLYREREDMTRMAANCDGAEIEVRKESTGRVWMLYVRKPG
ncbi:PilZ domain-containing protein [Minwuia sp.]|uniref:PilZ domain-containing protein n=1 Tax=Minwuia sp. TaxID=2493630 RepID=UPI003A9332FC